MDRHQLTKEPEAMNQIHSDSAELKILQQEVDELQNRKNQSYVNGNKASEKDYTGDRKPGLDSEAAEKIPDFGKSLHDLTTHVEGFVLEIEDLARERPALAILGAFTLGIIIGKLFSRK
jgi:hypothetical protein